MTTSLEAETPADAVLRFAADVRRRDPGAPVRVQAQLDGDGGMTRLCLVEAAIAELWPPTTAKELIWLTRAAPSGCDLLQLRAFGARGEVLGDATFRLAAAR